MSLINEGPLVLYSITERQVNGIKFAFRGITVGCGLEKGRAPCSLKVTPLVSPGDVKVKARTGGSGWGQRGWDPCKTYLQGRVKGREELRMIPGC